MKNFEVYQKNPLEFSLVNNGVSKVAEFTQEAEQLKTLRFELETFVCDGEYERGLVRILHTYLGALNRPEQPAVWVSGFYGSGKSHLAKMLRYLWTDFRFPDGASARSVARLPASVSDLLVELTNRSRQFGGLKAASGTLSTGTMDNVRLAFAQLLLRAAGLPEYLPAARFVLWLREKKLWDQFEAKLAERSLNPMREVRNLYVSKPLAEVLVELDGSFGMPAQAKAAITAQYPDDKSPTIETVLDVLRQVFADDGRLPCTLIVVDEVQQFIGQRIERSTDVQEIAEHCCADLESRVLLVGTGQSALNAMSELQKLQGRFTVKVALTDADVENVIRKTILLKKPEQVPAIKKAIADNMGEVSRHLQGTRIASTASDEPNYALDYPLLPTRRRFWERVLRSVDPTSTTAQLRTQLKVVYDAARANSNHELGTVVPADFIYGVIAPDLLNTADLQREYYDTIAQLADGTPAGVLKSRLCALLYLVAKLPRLGGADIGLRATPDTLADLLVEDLKKNGSVLRQQIPALLEELVTQGKVQKIEDEYRLQTKEGATWTGEFHRRRNLILRDDAKLGAAREEALAGAVSENLAGLNLTQGLSRLKRKVDISTGASAPPQPSDRLVLWVRTGWAEKSDTVIADARKAGNVSPMLFAFLPHTSHEELRQALASRLAAKETLDARGMPTTKEGTEARHAIETQLQAADAKVKECLGQVLSEAKVLLGGGSEANGLDLRSRVEDAAAAALQRLFPQFDRADNANWRTAFDRARAGDHGALQNVGHQGDPGQHPVCKAVYELVGPGKRGREVRDNFSDAPYGWPQDAVDAGLVVMTLAGNLKASVNSRPVRAQDLNQVQISTAAFAQDVPPLSVDQRMKLRALFQKAGIKVKAGEESAGAALFLARLLEMAAGAGGEPPLPEVPSTKVVRDLQQLSGNAQLLEILNHHDELARCIDEWKKLADSIAKRLPRWRRFKELLAHATDLAEAGGSVTAAAAIEAARGLLDEPDPIEPQIKTVVQILRTALNDLHGKLVELHKSEMRRLEASPIWQALKEGQRKQLVAKYELSPSSRIAVADENEILATLAEASIRNRRLMLEALPERFRRALDEAARLLEPKARRIALPSVTIKSEADLEQWQGAVEKLVKKELKNGPVIL
jgi:hypothetical protein